MSIPCIIHERTMFAGSCLFVSLSLGCQSSSPAVGTAGSTFVAQNGSGTVASGEGGSGGTDAATTINNTSKTTAIGANSGESAGGTDNDSSSPDNAGGSSTGRGTTPSGGAPASSSSSVRSGTSPSGGAPASSNTSRGGSQAVSTTEGTVSSASGSSNRGNSGGSANRGGTSSGSSSRGGTSSSAQTAVSSSFRLTSSTLDDGGSFPTSATCESSSAASQLPPLGWSGAPPDTKSFAIVFVDTTLIRATPVNTNGFHSAIWDIPATIDSLPEGLPAGSPPAGIAGLESAKQKKAPSGSAYLGPCPNFPSTADTKTDTYEFRLYALNVESLPSNVSSMTIQQIYNYLEALPPLGVAILSGTSNAGAATLK